MFGEIEGTGFEVIDPSFGNCLIGHARVERLWSEARWSDAPAHIRKHSVQEDVTLSGRDVLAERTNGLFNGFRVDCDGCLWTSIADGAQCLAQDGALIGKIEMPEFVYDVSFGGAKLNLLFI